MAELWFYHLERQRVEDALAGLLTKLRDKDGRALVVSSDEDRLTQLDAHLWTFKNDSFLAHGRDSEPRAEHQPILLSTNLDNINQSNMLFCLDGVTPEDFSGWDRVIVMFEGDREDQVQKARDLWKTSKSSGVVVSYWKQNEAGRWEKKS